MPETSPRFHITLDFEDNGKAHDDLVLRFGGQTWISDSYYLALDGGVMPGREDADKVRAVLKRLLEQWLTAVESLGDGHAAYLPYDFSDQCTGWLECRRSAETVTVSLGWASVEGWSFFPSEAGDLFTRPSGFHADGPIVHGAVSELTAAIRASLAVLARPDV
jgi:hypothetical protein